MYVDDANLFITTSNLINSIQGIEIYNSFVQISLTNFDSLGNNNIKGGALSLMNSDLSLTTSSFANNYAHEGGAVFLDCNLNCSFDISNNSFRHNRAVIQGGAVSYKSSKPNFTLNYYYNNTAQYGNNKASYPINIKILCKLKEITTASG